MQALIVYLGRGGASHRQAGGLHRRTVVGREETRCNAHIAVRSRSNLGVKARRIRLPAEAAELLVPGSRIPNSIDRTRYAVAIHVIGVGSRRDRRLVDGLKQAEAVCRWCNAWRK